MTTGDASASAAAEAEAVAVAAELERRVASLEQHPDFPHAQSACLASRKVCRAEFKALHLSGASRMAQLKALAKLMQRCQYAVQFTAPRVKNREAQLLMHYIDAIAFRRSVLEALIEGGMKGALATVLQRLDPKLLELAELAGEL
jgi:hypothetical protein